MALPRASRVAFGRARALRKTLTGAEAKLWAFLRRDSLGVRFRRQHPIGPYVADFACYPLKLVVEVDGATHAAIAGRRHDHARDAYLRREGWRVLRFANESVYQETEGVVEAIGLAVREARAERDATG
jgi:very-short-patch-repair endonuclease